MASSVPEHVSRFIRERLPSVEQIEIVLLMRRDAARTWTAPEVASQLGTPPESTAMRLFLLASNGLLAFEGSGVPRYRYSADAEVDGLVGDVMKACDENRAAVVELLGGSSAADPVRSFADAFRLKK